MMRIDFDKLRHSLRKVLSPRGALAAGVLVGGTVGLVALESRSGAVPEPSKAACCSSAVTIGDTMITPAIGADKDFFEVPSSPPSAMFLMGNNKSMLEFPKGQELPEDFTPGFYPPAQTTLPGRRGYVGKEGEFTNTGCTDPALVAAMSWFNKASLDPAKNGSVVYDTDTDFSTNPFFIPDVAYHARGHRVAWQTRDYPYSLSAFGTSPQVFGQSYHPNACYQVVNWNTSDYYGRELMAECESCLATKGWWRGPRVTAGTEAQLRDLDFPARISSEGEPPPAENGKWAFRKWVVTGRVLNLRPPKFVVARKVLKDVINMAPNVRMGVATFGKDHGWFDPPAVMEGLRPSCDLSFPTINETSLNRRKLTSAVNQIPVDNYERSIGEALFGLGGYFSTKTQWQAWFTNPLGGQDYWPGCCQPTIGTIDNPDTAQPGAGYAARSPDEWFKPPSGTGTLYRPGNPWEESPAHPQLEFKSVCFGCQVSSVIVLTDGEPRYDNSVPITKMMELLKGKGAKLIDGSDLRFDSSNPLTNTNSGGVNYCDQFMVEDPPGSGSMRKGTKAECDYTAFNWPHGMAVGNKNFMDDVAYFLANMDLRPEMPGQQTVRTYTIGYGDNSLMLQSIALAGKGKFYPAKEGTELRNAILDALGDIRQLSTSFASASISGVQTSGQSSVYVPRFVPRRSRPYEGHLFRFFYFSEFAQGCQPGKARSTDGDALDLNDDGDCDDTFFLDKYPGYSVGMIPDPKSFTKNNIVQENTEGTWVRVHTATAIDGGRVEGGSPAQPFWDVGETVGKRSAVLPCDPALRPGDPTLAASGRCIFTLIDRNNDGKYTNADNPPVEFHDKNVVDLKKYLLASGDAFCSLLFAKQNATWTGTPAQQDKCALELLRFVRGVDVFDYDGDALTVERPCADDPSKSCKLADIFHSTPVAVDPPVEPFLCGLGLSAQCASTLYEDYSMTVSSDPLCAAGTGGKPCYTPTPMDPGRSATKRYGSYSDLLTGPRSKRDRVVLVGSNGGMLHAIHVGTATSVPKAGMLDDIHDMGTGQELWAFIPPDLLPKLGRMVSSHEYFVDGTAMVRDIWADGSVAGVKDGKKQADEFRSLAIITERGGGQRYTALDMTDPYLMLKALAAPSDTTLQPFRWMFPNACDKESLSMGQSWSNYAPKPPPIGPVRLKPSASSAAIDSDRGYEERWVTVLNGGYSSDLSRGRGVYMLDAWTGQKLWTAEALPSFRAGSPYFDTLNKMGPIVASAALVDIGDGKSVQRDLDGFFDTLVVGDMLGQVWTFRFMEPGELDATTNEVKNWFGARSLEMDRLDGTLAGPANAHRKQPFFHIASNVLQPETGWLRSFVGTGDRQHLRGAPGEDCNADDLLACIRLKCNVRAVFSGEVNGQRRTSTIEYVGGELQNNAETWLATGGSACSASRMEITSLKLACPAGAYGSATFPSASSGTVPKEYKAESWCSGSAGAWTCDHINLNTSEKHNQLLSAAELTEVTRNHYFGFHAYGGARRTFNTEATAATFDTLRVTNTPGFTCSGISCSLVDVTIPDSFYKYVPVGTSGETQRYVSKGDLNKLKVAQTEDPGWFVRYNNTLMERTASGSTVLAGVVFWSSFSPSTSSGGAACALSGMGDRSYSWQADVITGLPDQASSFQIFNSSGVLLGYADSKGRGTSAPPGEPAPIVSLSETGGIRYEVSMSSPGTGPTTETLNNQSNVTPDIYWQEVPRNLHECRHVNAQACR